MILLFHSATFIRCPCLKSKTNLVLKFSHLINTYISLLIHFLLERIAYLSMKISSQTFHPFPSFLHQNHTKLPIYSIVPKFSDEIKPPVLTS
jgi:hypothetical protein